MFFPSLVSIFNLCIENKISSKLFKFNLIFCDFKISLKYFPSYFLKMNLTHMLGRYVAYYLILQHIRCY